MKKKLTMGLVVGLVAFSAGITWGFTEGDPNNFFGTGAGASNTGSNNSFFGGFAGTANTSGSRNAFLGRSAGQNNTTGIDNNFFGYSAGHDNVSGSLNNFFGTGAGYSNTANQNNFFGYYAGHDNISGSANSFFGHAAGQLNTTGLENSFFGNGAGLNNTTGSQNSFFGNGAGSANIGGDWPYGSFNSFFGNNAGLSNTTGYYNSFFGNSAGQANIDGHENSIFGTVAGTQNTTGYDNSFFGTAAGFSNIVGSGNSFFGRSAGENNNSFGNCFFGYQAGFSNIDGIGNVFLGYLAGANELGSSKLYIANSATDTPLIYGEFDNQYMEINGRLTVQATDANNSFSYKVLGHTGGDSHTQMVTDLADSRLTVMAAEQTDYAPRLAMVGPQDVGPAVRGWMVFDYGSGIYDLPNARFVLRHYGPGGIDDYAYMIETIGRETVAFPTGNIGIGTTSPNHLIELAGGAYSNGATWVNASSRELKKDIHEVSVKEAMDTVEKLQPVTFTYKKSDQDRHVGFIAEDVPDMVATSDRKGVETMDIVAVLTKVVQEIRHEQKESAEKYQETIEELKAKIGELETALQFKKDKDLNLAKTDLIQSQEKRESGI